MRIGGVSCGGTCVACGGTDVAGRRTRVPRRGTLWEANCRKKMGETLGNRPLRVVSLHLHWAGYGLLVRCCLNLNLFITMKHLVLHRIAGGMHAIGGRLVGHWTNHERITIQDVAEEISAASTLTPADVVGCITALVEVVSKHVGRGRSVSLGELGTFSASLRVGTAPATERGGSKPKHGTTEGVPADPRMDEAAVRVTEVRLGRVCFRAGRVLRHKIAEQIDRHVAKPKRLVPRQAPRTSTAERLALVQHYLRTHAVISVRQYAALAGLSHRKAAEELLWWRQAPDSGIGSTCQGVRSMARWAPEKSAAAGG